MGSFSQSKGKRGEREIARMFIATMEAVEKQLGLPGESQRVKRNTTQSDRGGDDLSGVPLLSVEVKFAETLQLNAWWTQCEAAALETGKRVLPVLFFRQSRKQWQAMTYAALTNPHGAAIYFAVSTMTAHDFMRGYAILYRSYLQQRGPAT